MPKQNRQPGIHLHKTSAYVGAIKTDKVNKNIYEIQWYWILIARNGKTIARSSETYKRKRSAVRSIEVAAGIFIGSAGITGGHYFDHTGKDGMKVDIYLHKSK